MRISILFFADHISNVAYGKFVAIARERKIPFSYLYGVNMEQIIKLSGLMRVGSKYSEITKD